MEVGQESDRLLGECRAALGLSRPVRIAVHPAVASPAVVGGLAARGARPARLGRLARVAPPRLPAARAGAPGPVRRLGQARPGTRPRPLLLPPPGALAPRPARPRAGAPLRRGGRGPGLRSRRLRAPAARPGPPPGPAARRHALVPSWLAPLPRPPHRQGPHRATPGGRHARAPSPARARPCLVPSFSAASPWPRPWSSAGSASARALPAASNAPGPRAAGRSGRREQRTDEFRGVVLDPDGRPVAGATIVAGYLRHEVGPADRGHHDRRRGAIPPGGVSPATESVEVYRLQGRLRGFGPVTRPASIGRPQRPRDSG